MSQKIIIPKGTIDSALDNIIEIPNYLHDVTTVMVTTAKTADEAAVEEALEGNDYNMYIADPAIEENETNWDQTNPRYYDQTYEAPEATEAPEYPTEQQEDYPYDPANDETENAAKMEQPEDQANSYGNYAEEVPQPQVQPQPLPPTRRPANRCDYYDILRKRIADRKREGPMLRTDRHRMLEGELGTYDIGPDMRQLPRENPNLAEVPENLRRKPRECAIAREKRRQLEFERFQRYSRSLQAGQQQPGNSRVQSTPRYPPEAPRQRFHIARPMNQWDVNVQQDQVDAQYGRGRPRQALGYPSGPPAPPQPEVRQEDLRQFQQQPRRKPVFNIPPKN